jgi:hypothetical protein
MILNKLAAGVTAIAIATTAMSVPAKAKNNDLTTLLAILAGGLVVKEVVDKRKDRKRERVTVTRDDYNDYKKPRDKRIKHKHRNGQWYTHADLAELRWYHRKDRHHKRDHDLDHDRNNSWGRDQKPDRMITLPIQDEIRKLPIPKKCHRTLNSRFGQVKHGVSRRCLQKRGYRINRNGVVSHHKWKGLRSRPILF